MPDINLYKNSSKTFEDPTFSYVGKATQYNYVNNPSIRTPEDDDFQDQLKRARLNKNNYTDERLSYATSQLNSMLQVMDEENVMDSVAKHSLAKTIAEGTGQNEGFVYNNIETFVRNITGANIKKDDGFAGWVSQMVDSMKGYKDQLAMADYEYRAMFLDENSYAYKKYIELADQSAQKSAGKQMDFSKRTRIAEYLVDNAQFIMQQHDQQWLQQGGMAVGAVAGFMVGGVAGAKVGASTLGTALGWAGRAWNTEKMFKLEAGSFARELRQMVDEDGNKMPQDVIKSTAIGYAVASSIVEQFDLVEKGVEKLAELSLKGTSAGLLFALKAIGNVVLESNEEGIQQALQTYARECAKEYSNELGYTNYEEVGDKYALALQEGSKEFISSLGPMIIATIMGMPVMAINANVEVLTESAKKNFEDKGEVVGLNSLDTGDTVADTEFKKAEGDAKLKPITVIRKKIAGKNRYKVASSEDAKLVEQLRLSGETGARAYIIEQTDIKRNNTAEMFAFNNQMSTDGLLAEGNTKDTLYYRNQEELNSVKQTLSKDSNIIITEEEGNTVVNGRTPQGVPFSFNLAVTTDKVKSKLKDSADAVTFNAIKKAVPNISNSKAYTGAQAVKVLSKVTGKNSTELIDNGIVNFVGVDKETTGSKLDLNQDAYLAKGLTREQAIELTRGWTDSYVDKKTGKTIYNINLTETANERTLVHEVGHVLRAMSSLDQLAGFAGLSGYVGELGAMWASDIKQVGDKWQLGSKMYDSYKEAFEVTRANEEKFVDDFLAYIETGRVANSKVKQVFDKIRTMLQRFNAFLGNEISPEAQKAFDKLISTPNTSTESGMNGTFFEIGYHGSGAEFEQFKNEYINTGAKSQAYGYGHYISDSDLIGKDYASMGQFTEYQRTVFVDQWTDRRDSILKSIEEERAKLEQYDIGSSDYRVIEEYIDRLYREAKKYQNMIDIYNSQELKSRNLYKVEIPDNNGKNYIDRNKKLPVDEVKKIHDALYNELIKTEEYSDKASQIELKKELEELNFATLGGTVYNDLIGYLGSDKEASRFLSDMGYVGLIYDAGQNYTLPAGAEGARNYVIFDPNNIDIIQHWKYETDEEASALFEIIGEVGADMLSDVKDQAFVLENLAKAKEALAQGVDINEIEAKYGWTIAKDGKWRYWLESTIDMFEAPDDITRWESHTTSLHNIYSNEKLYEAYPFLYNAKVSINRNYLSSSYDPEKHKIVLGTKIATIYDYKTGREKIFDSLIHEIQHAIQEEEGFAKGGDPDSVKSQLRLAINRSKVKKEEISNFENSTGMELYKRLLGEAEARQSARRALTGEYSIGDYGENGSLGGIPYSDQIVLFDMGDINDDYSDVVKEFSTVMTFALKSMSGSKISKDASRVELRKMLGLKEEGKVSVNEITKALAKYYKNVADKYGKDFSDLDNPENVAILAKILEKQIRERARLYPNNSAIGWYSDKIELAHMAYGELFEEINTDPDAEFMFDVILAITSQGQTVLSNAKSTVDAYVEYKKTGHLPMDVGKGMQAQAVNNNIGKINSLLDGGVTIKELRDFFNTKFTGSQLKSRGFDVSTNNTDSAYGSIILGPKIGGAFFSNIRGNYDIPTLDKWMSRIEHTFTGKVLKSNSVIEQFGNPEREFFLEVSKKIVKDLRKNNLFKGLTIADTQAVLWYNIKSLYDAIQKQAKTSLGADYETTASRAIAEKKASELYFATNKEKEAWIRDEVQRIIARNQSRRDDVYAKTELSDGVQSDSLSNRQARIRQRNSEENTELSREESFSNTDERYGDVYSNSGSNEKTVSRRERNLDSVQGLHKWWESGPRGVYAVNVRNSSFVSNIKEFKNGAKKVMAPFKAIKLSDNDFIQVAYSNELKVSSYLNDYIYKVTDGAIDLPDELSFLELARDSKTNQTYEESAKAFIYAMNNAVQNLKAQGKGRHLTVDVPSLRDINPKNLQNAGYRLFLESNGKAGFAIHGNEIKAVFADPSFKGASYAILSMAIAEGGRRMDAYDDLVGLQRVYSRFGFVPTARIKFSYDAMSPAVAKEWKKNKKSLGEPDVYFLTFDETKLDKEFKVATYELDKKNIPLIEGPNNYFDALKINEDITDSMYEKNTTDFSIQEYDAGITEGKTKYATRSDNPDVWSKGTVFDIASIDEQYNKQKQLVLNGYKESIKSATERGVVIAPEYLKEFAGEEWADKQLAVDKFLSENDKLRADFAQYDSFEEWLNNSNLKDMFINEANGEDLTEILKASFKLSKAVSANQATRSFLNTWISSDEKMLEFSKMLRNRTKMSKLSDTYFGAYSGISPKVLYLYGSTNENGRVVTKSTHEEIEQAKEIVRANPEAYRLAYVNAYDEYSFDSYGLEKGEAGAIETLQSKIDEQLAKLEADRLNAIQGEQISKSQTTINQLKYRIEQLKKENAKAEEVRKLERELEQKQGLMSSIRRMAKFNSDSTDVSYFNLMDWITTLTRGDVDRTQVVKRIEQINRELSSLNPSSREIENLRTEREELQNALENQFVDSIPAGAENYFNDSDLRRFANIGQEWSIEDLNTLYTGAWLIRSDAQAKYQSKKNEEFQRRINTARNLLNSATGSNFTEADIRNGYDINSMLGDLGQYRGDEFQFNVGLMQIIKMGRLARLLDGNTEGSAYNFFIRQVYDNQTIEKNGIRQRTERRNAKYEELGIKPNELQKVVFKYQHKGKEVEITKKQAIGVYVYFQQDLGREKLLATIGNGFTEEDINTIIGTLSENEKAFGDFLIEEMTSQYPKLSEHYMNVYNRILGKRRNYFPLISLVAFTNEQIGDFLCEKTNENAYVSKGFTKETNPNAIYELDLDVITGWDRVMRRQEHFMAYAEWARDAEYVLKQGNYKAVLNTKFGETVANNVEEYVNFIGAPAYKGDDFDNMLNSIIGKLSGAKIIGNMSSVLKQIGALGAGARTETSLRNLIKPDKASILSLLQAMNVTSSANGTYNTWKEFMYDKAPELFDRQYDADLKKVLSDMDKNTFGRGLGQVANVLSKPLQFVDGWVVETLWTGCFITQMQNSVNSNKSIEERVNDAVFIASQFVAETQNTTERMDMNAMMRKAGEGDSLMKLLTAFQSQTMNVANELWYDIPTSWKSNGKVGKMDAIRIAGGLVFNSMVMLAIGGTFWKRDDEDDEEAKKRRIIDIMSEFAENFIPIAGGDIMNTIQGYSNEDLLESIGTDIINTGKSIYKALVGDKEVVDALEDAISLAGDLSGIGSIGAKRVVQMINNDFNIGYLLNSTWGHIVENNR